MTKRKPKEEHIKPGPKDPVWNKENATALFQDMLNWMLENDTRVYWGRYLVINRGLYFDVVPYLIRKYPELSEFKKKLDSIQEIRLLEQRGHDTVKSIFVLKNKHGYEDKRVSENLNTNINKTDRDSLAKLSKDELLEQVRRTAGL